MSILSRLYRSPHDTRRIDSSWRRAPKYALLLLFAIASIKMFFVPWLEKAKGWTQALPVERFAPDAWHAYYGDSAEPCSETASLNCLANPNNKALWESGFLRKSPLHQIKVRENSKPEFWLGITIPHDQIQRAHEKNANFIGLGWVRGTYDVWINGDQWIKGNQGESNPIVIPLSHPSLARANELKIAVRISPLKNHPFPDLLGGSAGEGFFNREKNDQFIEFSSYWAKVRPFAFFLMYFTITLFFFAFWTVSSSKPEYFYMTAFTFSAALYQARLIDYFFLSHPTSVLYSVSMCLRFYEGAFGMFLGFAVARLPSGFFSLGVPTALVFPIAVNFFLKNSSEQTGFETWIGQWAVPALFCLGALACFLQLSYLRAQKKIIKAIPHRTSQLVWFGLGLAILGFVSALRAPQNVGSFGASYNILTHRVGHLILVLHLAIVLFREHRHQALLAAKTPVSEYHRMPELPKKLSGALFALDLKNSEPFYRQRAIQGFTDNGVSLWRFQACTAILRNGGTVLQKKGDEIISFFADDRCPDSIGSALKSFDEINELSMTLAQQWREQDLMPEGVDGFFFRASLVTGEIRPVWEDFGGIREPYWEEAGDSNTFVNSSRLLEFEKRLGYSFEQSTLILKEDLAVQVELKKTSSRTFNFRNREIKDKHGNAYFIAAFLV